MGDLGHVGSTILVTGSPILAGGSTVSNMATATWNGSVIASSAHTVIVEGNHYFLRESVVADLVPSETTSYCGWKGQASYASVQVDGATNVDAAWFYETPFDAAKEISGRIAFWKGVVVTDD